MYLGRKFGFAASLIVVSVLAVIAGISFAKYNLPYEMASLTGKLLTRYTDPGIITSAAPRGLDTSPCYCRINEGVCGCESRSRFESYDHEIWNQLERVSSRPRDRNPLPADELLSSATGFERIEPKRSERGGRIEFAREGSFGDGTLQELFIGYDRPKIRVRAILARNNTPAKDLMVIIPGSWTTIEHIMGLWPEDYYRRIGHYYYAKGLDVLAFDHGSNGHIEGLMNVAAVVEGGQILGVWSRSVCDVVDNEALMGQYDRIFLYGLSRGGRIVEYISALCGNFALAIVGDNFSPDEYYDYHWRSMNSAPYLKYSSWFLHLEPVIGHLSKADMMRTAKNPVVYTLSEAEVRTAVGQLSDSFDARESLDPDAKLRFVFKSDIGHTPELELIDKMLANRWADMAGVSLDIRPDLR